MHGTPIILATLIWSLPAQPSLCAFPLALADATGEMVAFTEAPRRIVSLNPDFTENLFALGAGDRIAGVTAFCDYPPAAAGKKKVGDLWTPNLEEILLLAPDLVLATQEGNRPQAVKALRELKLKVFVSPPARSVDGYLRNLSELARIVGAAEQGEELAARLRAEIGRARGRSAGRKRPRVFFQLGRSPLVTAARETIIGDLIEIAGGENIAAASPLRYPSFSREQVIADDPDIVIVALEKREAEIGRREWAEFASLSAAKSGRIFTLDPDLVSRSGPRLVEGLRALEGMIRTIDGQPHAEGARSR